MENVIIQGNELEKLLQEAIPKVLKETLTSSYSTNPLKSAIEAEIKEQEGIIKQFVRGVMADILTKDEFKKKVSDELLMQIIQKGLRN